MNMPTLGNFKLQEMQLSSSMQIFALVLFGVFISACAPKQIDPYNETETQKAVISNTSLGLEYMNRGQYEVALGKLKKAIKEDPRYAPAQTVIAVLYERIGELDLAGKHYKKAYELTPADGDVNNNYGVYLCKTGHEDEAIKHFLVSLDDPFYSTPAIALTNAGSCALAKGDYVEADEFLRRALKIEADLSDALINMSKLQYRQKNYLMARAFMPRYEDVASHGAETLLLAYQIEAGSNNSKAANAYKRMLEANFPETDQAEEVRRLSGK